MAFYLILILMSMFMGLGFFFLLYWGIKTGQFKNPEEIAKRMLKNEENSAKLRK